MKKQVLCIIPAILAAGAVSAQGFDGFYIGAGIGDSVTVGRNNLDASRVVSDATGARATFNGASFRGATKKENFVGALFAGYGWGCDCWYLGGEVYVKGFGKHSGRNAYSFANIDNTNGTTATETVGARTKLRSAEWGIDFRPGFLIGQCTMLYGRVGAAFNRTQVNLFHSASISNGVATVSANDFYSKKKSRTSLRLGAGLEHRFCECWSVRADWVYTNFRKVNTSVSSSRAGLPVGTTATTVTTSANANTKLHNHTMMLGLSYFW